LKIITQGKWEIDLGHRFAVNCGKKHIAMVNVFTDKDTEVSVCEEEGLSNACLIAAAPELLTACKELTKLLNQESLLPMLDLKEVQIIRKAEAAIKAAEKTS